MQVVDAHCHIYPSKIAEKAVDSVGEFYQIEMLGSEVEGVGTVTRGTGEHLLGVSAPSDITRHIVYSVAIKPSTVRSINDFIAAECAANGQFVGFMAMHQDFEDMEAEVDRAVGLGLKGIKLHPDTQGVDLDDPRLMRLYQIAEARDLPVVIHTGDYRYDYSHPRRLRRVLHEFPRLRVNGAHFGGWSVFDLACEILEHERCFVDVSSSMRYLGRRRSRELIELYGADRVLFGSDFPMWSPAEELEHLRALELDRRDMEKILLRNAERFVEEDLA